MSARDATASSSEAPAFEKCVGALLRRLFGEIGAIDLRPLAGGAMQEMWAIAADRGGAAPRRFVLRRLIGEAESRSAMALDLEKEAALLRAAARGGVPTPEVHHVLAPEDGLGRGYLMAHVEGETIPAKIFRSEALDAARRGLAAQCGEILAKIHALPLSAEMGFLADYTPQSRLDMLYQGYREGGQPRPVYEYAFRWLRERVSEMPTRRALVHGDFRHGNLMIDPSGLAAVLDWELAHINDPLADLGWLCVPSWRFGRMEKPVGGFGDVDELRRGYVSGGGEAFTDAQLHFWIVFGAAMWGVTCIGFATRFRAGERIVERGVIGRRASEVEIDLLSLLNPRGMRRC